MTSDKPMPSFRTIAAAPLEADDRELDALNARLGVPTLQKSTAAGSSDASEPARAALEKLTLEVPDYLARALRREAADRKMSVRHLVILALQKEGYEIADADLVPDGRRGRKAR